ncbi:MAG: hypothetical protein AUG16_03315 [Thaumarchaeota archaeon 13_1_20CM_2_39_20]|nr:MAG: hypothetical protein AUG16_03315 [Thaumarchaeota archaeon 13_1_20CM_2_39_20]
MPNLEELVSDRTVLACSLMIIWLVAGTITSVTLVTAQKDNIVVEFASSFGSGGSENGQFAVPQGIALDKSGNIYVVDQNNNRVEKFDSNGNFVSKLGTFGSGDGQLNAPTRVALDKSGNVYVTDISNYRVDVFDSKGNFVFKFGSFGSGPGEFGDPQGIAVDKSGNIYVADLLNNVQKFDSTGKFISQFCCGTDGIALDKSGNIYVVDSGNSRVEKLNPSGNLLLQFGNNRVEIFDSKGNFLSEFGTFGSGDGQFADPLGIAVDKSGYIYVVDQNNERVEIFSTNHN